MINVVICTNGFLFFIFFGSAKCDQNDIFLFLMGGVCVLKSHVFFVCSFYYNGVVFFFVDNIFWR